VHNFERRLERIERELASASEHAGGGGSGVGGSREFLIGVLDSISHVRRTSLDEGQPDAYSPGILENLAPFELAQYACALCILSHADADGARRRLVDGGGGGFIPFIENVVSHHLEGRS